MSRRGHHAPTDIEGALNELGIEVHRSTDDEVTAYCPGHLERVGREEQHPSWSVNRRTGLMNCLGGETPVVTRDGVRRIDALAGGYHDLLTPQGWVRSPVRSYGRQRLYAVRMSRNGVQREVRATAGHRWFVRGTTDRGRLREVTTADLRTGHRLATVVPRRSGTLVPSRYGAAAGVVFGDGTLYPGGTRVALFGDKDEALLDLFPWGNRVAMSTPNGVPGVLVDGLPRAWKARPDLDESSSFLYGWLAGYFAADGHVSDTGLPMLSSADRSTLEFVETLCLRVGVVAHGITEQQRLGYGVTETPLYRLTFSRRSLSADFFLTHEHRRRWEANATVRERLGWVVREVVDLDVEETVYCAEVPVQGRFALAGQLLTGNCYSCGFSGTFIDLVMFRLFPNDVFRAARWIRQFGLDLARSSEIVSWAEREQLLHVRDEPAILVPETRLAMYDDVPGWALEARSISRESVDHYGVRWDTKSDAWIVPVRHPSGALAGWQKKWQKRRRFINEPREMVKSECLFGLDVFPVGEPAVLLESPLDVCRLHSAGYEGGLGLFGSAWSRTQVVIVVNLTEEVISALDNDESGNKAAEELRVGKWERGKMVQPGIPRGTHLRFFSYKGIKHKDIGGMTDDEIVRGLYEAEHSTAVRLGSVKQNKERRGFHRGIKAIPSTPRRANGRPRPLLADRGSRHR